MLTRVSNIETWRRWRSDEDATPDDLVARLTAFEPTEAMLAGTAFHKALELAQPGEYAELSALGYTFLLADAELALPTVRELRCFGNYGPLRVTGQVDALYGKRVEDHKTTANFSADGYLEGCQWRFYLDLFGADVFRWNVFEIKPVKDRPNTYEVGAPHLLEQCRYPGLHDDCMDLARGFYDFAALHMPQHNIPTEQAA
jgi:hypothetical protein